MKLWTILELKDANENELRNLLKQTRGSCLISNFSWSCEVGVLDEDDASLIRLRFNVVDERKDKVFMGKIAEQMM